VADLGEAVRLLTMAGLATAAGVLVSWLTPEDPERLRNLFERTRPPGFWGPVAVSAGVDPAEGPRRLGRGGIALATTAASLFCLLTGLGSWVAHSPAPVWWSVGWEAWIASQVLIGGALVPVWWRLGIRDAYLGSS
jgi:hypothetical protein